MLESVFDKTVMKLSLVAALAVGGAVFSLSAKDSSPARETASSSTMTVLDPQKVVLSGDCGSRMRFAPGETMPFVVTVDFGGQKPSEEYFVKWLRTGDDGKTAQGKVKVVDGQKIAIDTSLDVPGFVRIYAVLTDGNGRELTWNARGTTRVVCFAGGAGVEIDRLRGVPEPKDFDAFWARQKAKLAAVPLKAELTRVGVRKNVEIYAVSVACAGARPVTGYMSIPLGAQAKSLPVTLNYQGYGTTVQQPPKDGPVSRIYFNVNAHGYDLGRDAGYYKKFFEGIRSNGHRYASDDIQNSDPETAYFNGMALRVMRSVEFVKTLPQWDGKNIEVNGGSQGGLQSIWAAGLDSDVTLAVIRVPWCCDLGGMSVGRTGGWRKKYIPALDYFDPVNHAKRVKCPVKITRVGLGDKVSPPTGIAILYNNLKVPKSTVYVQGSTHGFVPPNAQRFTFEGK